MTYELIIKEIGSGEVVCRRKCDCVIGAIAGADGENITANTINFVQAPVAACLTGLAAAQDACDNIEKYLYEDFNEFVGGNASTELFKEFLEHLREKGKANRVTISVDEDAIKTMIKGEDSQ